MKFSSHICALTVLFTSFLAQAKVFNITQDFPLSADVRQVCTQQLEGWQSTAVKKVYSLPNNWYGPHTCTELRDGSECFCTATELDASMGYSIKSWRVSTMCADRDDRRGLMTCIDAQHAYAKSSD